MTDETNPLDALRRSVPDDDRLESAIADRIESRLRVAHAEANRSRPVRWWRPALAAPVAVLLVVALSLAVVLRGSDPAAALVVTDAENVTVRLPDGKVVTRRKALIGAGASWKGSDGPAAGCSVLP